MKNKRDSRVILQYKIKGYSQHINSQHININKISDIYGARAFIKGTNEIVIGIAIHKDNLGENSINLLINTSESQQGKGYMLEALDEFGKKIFNIDDKLTVINKIEHDNDISIKFHESFGFEMCDEDHEYKYYSINKMQFDATQEMRNKKIQDYKDKENRQITFDYFSNIANNSTELFQ